MINGDRERGENPRQPLSTVYADELSRRHFREGESKDEAKSGYLPLDRNGWIGKIVSRIDTQGSRVAKSGELSIVLRFFCRLRDYKIFTSENVIIPSLRLFGFTSSFNLSYYRLQKKTSCKADSLEGFLGFW